MTTAAREYNQSFLEALENGMQKQAADEATDFTRTTMREDGFARVIMPAVTLGNDDFDRQVDTPKPVKIVDKEPGSPAAISVPYATQPVEVYVRGPRYKVTFNRLMTPRFTVDVSELRTWTYDIRQVMSDNSLKDLLTLEDTMFLTAVEAGLGSLDSVNSHSGVVQWQTVTGGITRDTWEYALTIMHRTPSRLSARRALLNFNTIHEFKKWRRDEMGGDLAQDIVKNGWTMKEFDGVELIITIKQDIVADNDIYFFSDNRFIGKTYELEPTKMWVEAKAFMVEWYAYEEIGGSIGHTGGLAAATFE
jgi:hypothetical protein